MPLATLQPPVVTHCKALQPKAELVAVVQPSTRPATVGVAGEPPPPPAAPQQMALLPFDIRTCPAVPVEAAQSMMPAPGLIALVESPVSQLLVGEKPIASWQEPVGSARKTESPIETL